MRIRVSLSLLGAAACVMAVSAPVWAKQLSTNLDVTEPTKIATAELKPGQYKLVANESTGQVQVVRDGKVVAQVKGQWVKTNKKTEYSEILSNNNIVQEVLFGGKDQAIKFNQ